MWRDLRVFEISLGLVRRCVAFVFSAFFLHIVPFSCYWVFLFRSFAITVSPEATQAAARQISVLIKVLTTSLWRLFAFFQENEFSAVDGRYLTFRCVFIPWGVIIWFMGFTSREVFQFCPWSGALLVAVYSPGCTMQDCQFLWLDNEGFCVDCHLHRL